MFVLLHNELKSPLTEIKPDNKKVQQFRIAHEDIELFVIEEALTTPPARFGLMDEMMTAAFNDKHVKTRKVNCRHLEVRECCFLAIKHSCRRSAVYDDGRMASYSQRTKAGQLMLEKYLFPNCIYLQQRQRNGELLGEICDRTREGKLTEKDCTMLTYQRTRSPDVCTDYGIHYANNMVCDF